MNLCQKTRLLTVFLMVSRVDNRQQGLNASLGGFNLESFKAFRRGNDVRLSSAVFLTLPEMAVALLLKLLQDALMN